MQNHPFICENISVDTKGELCFAGQNLHLLAEQYGTPLYLLDEDRIRENCRRYRRAFAKHFGDNNQVLYASKANAFCQMYRIMREEGMGVDVVSMGEIATACRAGFDLKNAYFHSNNKTDEDIRFAMESGIGYFVADNEEELRAIEAEAARRSLSQKVLLRLTPGIDPHTYEAVSTGKVDSKFGSAIATGQAEEMVRFALQQPHIELEGFHCHVGSQVFAEDVFERTAVVMLEFVAQMQEKHGYLARVLDLGGGFGVRYVDSDPYLDMEGKIVNIAKTVQETCQRLHLSVPKMLMEPGRSIVADAGMTLYRVGSVKRIPGYKNYISVDGGMPDNPRFALYHSSYTCLPVHHREGAENFRCSVVGRCCESGDIIQENVPLPEEIKRGDLLAVCTTGAYNYSMASNYNRIPRPPIVMLREGTSYVAVRRESMEDLLHLDV